MSNIVVQETTQLAPQVYGDYAQYAPASSVIVGGGSTMFQPVTTTYVEAEPIIAPAIYAEPYTAPNGMATYTTMMPTTTSMVAYPQMHQGPFVFYPSTPAPAPTASPAKPAAGKRDATAKKKKAKKCGCC